jgi:hypothetical protein
VASTVIEAGGGGRTDIQVEFDELLGFSCGTCERMYNSGAELASVPAYNISLQARDTRSVSPSHCLSPLSITCMRLCVYSAGQILIKSVHAARMCRNSGRPVFSAKVNCRSKYLQC